MACRIYCPKCEWAPGPEDRWICLPGCQCVWNTFETAARCPGCSKQWRVTFCHRCGVGSAHEDWYHDETPAWDDAASDVGEEELVGV